MKRLRKLAALAAVLAVTAAAFLFVHNASALPPPDAQRTFPARVHATQQVSYFRAVVNFNDAGIATGRQFGTLPANAYIVNVQVEIVTAFNAVTTNVLTFGTTTAATQLVSAADTDETATGVTSVSRGLGRSLTASGDTALYAKYTQTGTAATAGKAIIVITYLSDNDL